MSAFLDFLKTWGPLIGLAVLAIEVVWAGNRRARHEERLRLEMKPEILVFYPADSRDGVILRLERCDSAEDGDEAGA